MVKGKRIEIASLSFAYRIAEKEFFFFSSRRRHTIFDCDWSSDVCSSDLFAALFVARAAVGIGEAAYGTISPALLADYFPRERRGRVFAVFFAAIPVGSALGYVVGGLVDRYFGWRQAFLVARLPRLVLAGLAWRLYDPPRGAQDPDAPVPVEIGRASCRGR